MISHGAIMARLAVIDSRHHQLEQVWEQVKDLPDEVEANVARKTETMAALYVSLGRIQECKVWLEWGEKFPHVERADQMPTEGNMLRHDAISDKQTEGQAWREREITHRGNADQLSAALPDLP